MTQKLPDLPEPFDTIAFLEGADVATTEVKEADVFTADQLLAHREEFARPLMEAIRRAGQVIAWQCYGDCRAYGEGPMPTAAETMVEIDRLLALYERKEG